MEWPSTPVCADCLNNTCPVLKGRALSSFVHGPGDIDARVIRNAELITAILGRVVLAPLDSRQDDLPVKVREADRVHVGRLAGEGLGPVVLGRVDAPLLEVDQLATGLLDPALGAGGPVAGHRRVPVNRDGVEGLAARRGLDEGAAVAEVAADAARGDNDGVVLAEFLAHVRRAAADPAVLVATGAFGQLGRHGLVLRKWRELVESWGTLLH